MGEPDRGTWDPSVVDELQKCVVGAQEPDGSVVFQYGWTRAIETRCEVDEVHGMSGWRRDRETDWTTSLHWAGPPKSSRTYPTDADFAEQLPEGQRELTAGAAPG